MESILVKANLSEQRSSEQTILLPASKSISNRALILNALSKSPGQIYNLAECDDTDVLSAALTSKDETNFNIGAAGTAMRFLTAYLAGKPGDWTITGSERMKQRPIGILVDALNNIGAEISYLEKEGFPPLKIHGKKLSGGIVHLNGGVSSQFISALLMIAPTTQKGIALHLEGEIISRPYIEMTLQMMKEYGVDSQWEGKSIQIASQEYQTTNYTVESDWSAASYWYEIAALSTSAITFMLPHLYEKSLQGDSMG
ncbi:MAG: 3-phosphoshikimate 1-carboxyvinyltransferase, partial [Paludibacteraceae bacterium]|nr:3-phosphoshikimate 1-carboxyvinyltransferase [Paludibacteraceae bacterium]